MKTEACSGTCITLTTLVGFLRCDFWLLCYYLLLKIIGKNKRLILEIRISVSGLKSGAAYNRCDKFRWLLNVLHIYQIIAVAGILLLNFSIIFLFYFMYVLFILVRFCFVHEVNNSAATDGSWSFYLKEELSSYGLFQILIFNLFCKFLRSINFKTQISGLKLIKQFIIIQGVSSSFHLNGK